MVKKIRKLGNSHAIPLDKAVMEQLGIEEGDDIVLTVHGATLTVRAAHVGLSASERKDAVKRFRAKYDTVLKRLAK